ncbi:MAG TPA: PspA/IM30 family protein [Acidimicrobiales bacterium]|jgi:phage shock protein A|nr:PspA/IM30 family protein [Acidimicrobiales bacterium]
MSIFKRLSLVFQQKANSALDRAENPTEALDLSYQKMLEQLQQVRRSIADVLTAQKRLEGQRKTLQAQQTKLQTQARQALGQGQDQLARTALERSQVVATQVENLGPQIENLQNQESQLELTGQKLQAKVEAFRVQRDTMKAQYTAAKASTSAVEGITGLSEEMADVSLMVERAQDKVQTLQARADAVGELADSGALDMSAIGQGPGDDIDRQLREVGAGDAIDQQLAAMKAELGQGGEPPPAAELGEGTIVVRVANADQYQLPVAVRPALDGLDAALVRAIEANDAEGFAECTGQLIKLIHSTGEKLPQDELRSSDLIVPSAEMSVEEARRLMADHDDAPAGGDQGDTTGS